MDLDSLKNPSEGLVEKAWRAHPRGASLEGVVERCLEGPILSEGVVERGLEGPIPSKGVV